jgi:hypothetical protein
MLHVLAGVESSTFETRNFATLSRSGRGRAGSPLHAGSVAIEAARTE